MASLVDLFSIAFLEACFHFIYGSCPHGDACKKSHRDPGVNAILDEKYPLQPPMDSATDHLEKGKVHICVDVWGLMFGGPSPLIETDAIIYLGNNAMLDGRRLDMRDPEGKSWRRRTAATT